MKEKHYFIQERFVQYIQKTNTFNAKEKEHILELFEDNYVQFVFHLGFILLIWTFAVSVIEPLLFGSGAITAVASGGLELRYFLPAIIFILVNITARFFFIHRYLKPRGTARYAILGAVPYAGVTILLGVLLKQEPIFIRAMQGYAKYSLKHVWQYIKHIPGHLLRLDRQRDPEEETQA